MSTNVVKLAYPSLTDIVSKGDSYQTITNTAFDPITAIPTTTAALVLWNGESQTSGTGKSYIIDSVALVRVVIDVTQVDTTAIFAMLNQGPVTAPTDDTNLKIRSLSGRKNVYAGLAKKAVAQSVTNHTWFPLGYSPPVASVIGGSAWNVADVRLDGLYIVPPGGQFNLHAVQVAAAASVQCHLVIRWHEAFLPIPLL